MTIKCRESYLRGMLRSLQLINENIELEGLYLGGLFNYIDNDFLESIVFEQCQNNQKLIHKHISSLIDFKNDEDWTTEEEDIKIRGI